MAKVETPAKKGLHPAIAFALMVVMVCCALFMGANKAWVKERKSLISSANVLESAIAARAETARNVMTVASRHMPEGDETIKRLAGDTAILEDKSASLPEKAAACERVSADAKAVLNALSALGSVKADSRDMMYASQMLPQAVEQSAPHAAAEAYNTAAGAFNTRINKSFSGWLARLTGVSLAPIFAPQEGETP